MTSRAQCWRHFELERSSQVRLMTSFHFRHTAAGRRRNELVEAVVERRQRTTETAMHLFLGSAGEQHGIARREGEHRGCSAEHWTAWCRGPRRHAGIQRVPGFPRDERTVLQFERGPLVTMPRCRQSVCRACAQWLPVGRSRISRLENSWPEGKADPSIRNCCV